MDDSIEAYKEQLEYKQDLAIEAAKVTDQLIDESIALEILNVGDQVTTQYPHHDGVDAILSGTLFTIALIREHEYGGALMTEENGRWYPINLFKLYKPEIKTKKLIKGNNHGLH